jgi:hypothetical protein
MSPEHGTAVRIWLACILVTHEVIVIVLYCFWKIQTLKVRKKIRVGGFMFLLV